MSGAVKRSIEQKIASGDYYDAQQMVKTAFRRLRAKGQEDAAAEFCVQSAAKFSESQQHDLAADLGVDLVDSLRDSESTLTAEHVNQIASIVKAIPAHAAVTTKYRMLNKALKWSAISTGLGHPELHRIAAESYLAEQEFGKCQGHFVYCSDGLALAEMVRRWRQEGYPNERDLFSLRVLLMLLALNDIDTARSFWNNIAGDVFRTEDVAAAAQPEGETAVAAVPEPAVQAGSFLLAAVAASSHDFFKAVRAKYTLVFLRDSTFAKYLDEIEARIFGVRQPKEGFGALFDMLMGGGNQ
eukprot:TRINITY_DN79074_c0_g1_i1.p1 TRINITY_DN79074_c0_g1~~TRINITY_DN79074_c0_g1_i1.p1  ORF type:complete len:298 (-),score=65.70 TRINITY_DN79074_c0_g1_i1:72-965(-)